MFFGLTLSRAVRLNGESSGPAARRISPPSADLGLTDVQAALAIGHLAAAALNALFMPPVPRLVDIISRRLDHRGRADSDRHPRPRWPALSSTFSQLFIVRMISAASVAPGNAPATFSILADYFPAAKLLKALAVMNIGFTTARRSRCCSEAR